MSTIGDYPPRLRWAAGKGIAAIADLITWLGEPPALGFAYVELDYAPAVRVAQVRREYCEAPEDLTPAERQACAEYLRKLGADEVPDLSGDK